MESRGRALKLRFVRELQQNCHHYFTLVTMNEEYDPVSNNFSDAAYRFINFKLASGSFLEKFFFIDSCTLENKNHFVFAYLELLLLRNVFKRIKFGFRPVRHSCEDINQTFAKNLRRLLSDEAQTLAHFQDVLRTIFQARSIYELPKRIMICSGIFKTLKPLLHVVAFSHYK